MSIFIEWVKLIVIWLFTILALITFISLLIYEHKHQKPWYQSWSNCFSIIGITISLIFCIKLSIPNYSKSIPHHIEMIKHEQQLQKQKEEQRKQKQIQHDEEQRKKINKLRQTLDNIEFQYPLSDFTSLNQLNEYKKQIQKLDNGYYKDVLLNQVNHIIQEFKNE